MFVKNKIPAKHFSKITQIWFSKPIFDEIKILLKQSQNDTPLKKNSLKNIFFGDIFCNFSFRNMFFYKIGPHSQVQPKYYLGNYIKLISKVIYLFQWGHPNIDTRGKLY